MSPFAGTVDGPGVTVRVPINELPLALAKIGVNASIAVSNHAGRQSVKGLIVYVSYQRFSFRTRHRQHELWGALAYTGFSGGGVIPQTSLGAVAYVEPPKT